jgi:hypothetical protein
VGTLFLAAVNEWVLQVVSENIFEKMISPDKLISFGVFSVISDFRLVGKLFLECLAHFQE